MGPGGEGPSRSPPPPVSPAMVGPTVNRRGLVSGRSALTSAADRRALTADCVLTAVHGCVFSAAMNVQSAPQGNNIQVQGLQGGVPGRCSNCPVSAPLRENGAVAITFHFHTHNLTDVTLSYAMQFVSPSPHAEAEFRSVRELQTDSEFSSVRCPFG